VLGSPLLWTALVMGIGLCGAVALKGAIAVSLAEVPEALFMIGRSDGRWITVRVSMLWEICTSVHHAALLY